MNRDGWLLRLWLESVRGLVCLLIVYFYVALLFFLVCLHAHDTSFPSLSRTHTPTFSSRFKFSRFT